MKISIVWWTIKACAVCLVFAGPMLAPGSADSSPKLSMENSRFRALEALFFLPMGAFPARELHTLTPGDLIDIERGTALVSADNRQKNPCFSNLSVRGPFDSGSAGYGSNTSVRALIEGAGSAGPGGLIAINAAGRFLISKTATFKVDPLAQKDPVGGELNLLQVSNKEDCLPYLEVLSGNFQGRVIVSRAFRGREALTTSIILEAGAGTSIEKSELLSVLEAASGIGGLPIDSISLSANGEKATFTVISKPKKGHIALAFVPLHLNRDQVAAVHFFLSGARGVQLRNLVDEALLTPDPSSFSKVIQAIKELLGQDLEDGAWAKRFLGADPDREKDAMRLTSAVVDELEGETPGVLQNIAYYAAAVELSVGSSEIGSD